MKNFLIKIKTKDITLGVTHASFIASGTNRKNALVELQANPYYKAFKMNMAHAYAVHFSIKPIRA